MSHKVYRFDNYSLDASARELLCDGEAVSLPPKSYECLAYLIEQRERAVGRDELISAVWGRVDVSDAVLAQTLRRARVAIGDSGSEQAKVRTVPRFGYHWVADVTIVDSSDLPSADAPSEDEPATLLLPTAAVGRKTHTAARLRLLLVVIVVAVVGLALAWVWASRHSSAQLTPAAGSKPLVAVMPVNVQVQGDDAAWVRLGVMDYLASHLRDSDVLNVVPSDQMVAIAGSSAGRPHTATGLLAISGARWVVSSSAHEDGGQWQLHLHVAGKPAVADVDAAGSTPLAAAAQASQQLLRNMGFTVAVKEAPAPTPLAERIQRVDAAMLGGHLDAAQHLVDGAPAAQSHDPALRVRAGQIAFRQGNVDAAANIYNGLLDNPAALPRQVLASTYMGLGAVAVRRGKFAHAQGHYAKALTTLGHDGDANLLGQAYIGSGVSYGARGDYDHAETDLGLARVNLKRAGNALAAASVDVNLGLIASHRQRYSQAIGYFDRAEHVFRRDNVRDNLAASLLGKVSAQLALMDIAGARASSKEAWSIAVDLDNPILVSRIGVSRATVLVQTGSLRAADAVLDDFQSQNVDVHKVALLRARIALDRGDAKMALTLLQPVVAKTPAADFAALPVFVAAAVASGATATASQVMAQLDGHSATDPSDGISVALARAALAKATGDAQGAAGALHHAVKLARDSGVPANLVRTGTAWTQYLIDNRQLDQASAVVGELAPYAKRSFAAAQVTAELYKKLGDTRLAATAQAQARQLAGERDLARQPVY